MCVPQGARFGVHIKTYLLHWWFPTCSVKIVTTLTFSEQKHLVGSFSPSTLSEQKMAFCTVLILYVHKHVGVCTHRHTITLLAFENPATRGSV